MNSFHPLLAIRRQLLLALLLCVLDIAYFAMTNPVDGHVIVIAVGGILAVASIYAFCASIVGTVCLLWNLSANTKRGLKIVGSIIGSFLLLMQSIGQLSLRDAVAAMLLAITLYVYIVYPSARPRV